MFTSLYTGVSGMDSNETALSVVGDNIANMNTVGFKSSGVAFDDVLSQTLTGGSSQVGRGVLVGKVSPTFTQGSFESTSNALDMAIDGDGFFIVSNGQGDSYTRAGQFSLDKNGDIVNPDGLVLQGYPADASGNITGTLGNLQIAATESPAHPTGDGTAAGTGVNLAINLDAGEQAPAGAFSVDPVTGAATNYNKTTTVTVYDSQGGAHDVTAYFVKSGAAANTWDVHYVYQDATGAYNDAGTQTLGFDNNGMLTSGGTSTMTFNWGNGATSPQTIGFNFGSGSTGSTQFSSAFSVTALSQDGYAAGSLKNLTIAPDGTITGVFTNGQTRTVGQMALAKFVAPTELTKLGRNLYGQSYQSGQPIVSTPESSGLGRVLSNTLEQSNVDLAQEFVKMISAQRGFEANSKIITTTDQLMQDLVNLIR